MSALSETDRSGVLSATIRSILKLFVSHLSGGLRTTRSYPSSPIAASHRAAKLRICALRNCACPGERVAMCVGDDLQCDQTGSGDPALGSKSQIGVAVGTNI